MKRIILVEDQTILRETLVVALSKEKDFEVIGHWDDAETALEFFHINSCDIVLTDRMLPGIDGLTFTKMLKEINPSIKVLMLSMVDKEESILEAFHAGVDGYMPKDVSINELIDGIRNITSGDSVLGKRVTGRFVRYITNLKNEQLKQPENEFFSDDELLMLKLARDGFSNKEIATELNIPLPTVKFRFHEVFRKLGAKDRTNAVIKAIKSGFIALKG